jgi:transcriptional regulator of arginine metabolism
MRSERLRDLTRILRGGHAATQKEIVRALRAAGHDVTQATVSRDLQEVGAAKVRVGRTFEYRLQDHLPRTVGGDLMARNLQHTLAEFAVDVTVAATLVVVTTAPGHAAAVARAIDLAGALGVVGTIAGDDTIFVATPDSGTAAELARAWNGSHRERVAT